MPEKSSPEHYTKPSKERRLPSKKRWMEMVREYMEISATITPDEAFKRVKQIKYSSNPHLSVERREREKIAEMLRSERLRRQGFDPEKWALYTKVQPEEFRAGNTSAEFTEADMAKWSAKFPKGIELFVTQGAISSGSEYVKEENPFKEIHHFWEVYVRVKPENILEAPPPQLKTFKENPHS